MARLRWCLASVALYGLVCNVQASQCTSPRNVYLDLGANWANTIRLFESLEPGKDQWEVFSFEADPFISAYVDEFAIWLNGGGQKPVLRFPPAGSSNVLLQYAGRYGCEIRGDPEKSKQCMFRKFKPVCEKMVPISETLRSHNTIHARLALAKCDAQVTSQSKYRYVFIPAAVGGKAGSLRITTQCQLLGHGLGQNVNARSGVTVPIIDLPSWIVENFNYADNLVVKMDVEGAEFSIFQRLFQMGAANLIDKLAIECHGHSGNCAALIGQIRRTNITLVSTDPPEFDAYSSPSLYYPVSP